MWPTILASVLPGIVERALSAALRDPTVPLDSPAPRQAAEAVKKRVVEEVRSSPEVQHAASTERWYQSRANWAAIVSAVTPLAALAGYTLSPESQEFVAGGLALAGGWFAAYLARRARTAARPLGA